MAIRTKGAIGDLATYAILTTYQYAPGRNRNRCACKGCGAQLTKGAGQNTAIRNVRGQWVYYYFCVDCCAAVGMAVQSPSDPPPSGK